MGSIYLDGITAPSLLEVIASSGVPVTGWAGWQTRSRSSGGYSAPPMALVCHHTASPYRSTPGQQFANDASYCAVGHADAPVANMVLGPEGQVSVHAAGASNHAGSGGPWTTSRGLIPQDGANSRTIAVEASNDGQGQPWPRAQQDAYVAITRAMAQAYGFRLDSWAIYAADVLSHEEWTRPSCPGRKCDPAGPSAWSPKPAGGCSAGNLWRMDTYRATCAQGAPIDENEETMLQYIVPMIDANRAHGKEFARWGSGALTHATNADELLRGRLGVARDGVVMGNDQYANLCAQAGVAP